MLFVDIDIDNVNYADDATPYVYDLEDENEIKLLEKNIDKLFDRFSYNFYKANPDKCDLLINTDENVKSKIKNKTITNSSNQKLLGILFHNIFGLDEYIASLCRRSSNKLNVLASGALYELGTT